MHENVRLFDEVIRKAGSKTALYMTWARKNALKSQQQITDAYTDIGREIGATLIPAGLAWARFIKRHFVPALHDKDLSHPTLAGSYLAACVAYAALFGADPVGNSAPIDMAPSDAGLLQAAAADAVGDQS
jgi:hypothetical protein